MHALTFKLKQTTIEEPGVSATVELDIYARVNGMPLLEQDGNYTFDFHAINQAGACTTPINPFVCSCGNAACAGINAPVEMVVTENTVTWNFPEEPFRDTLNPKLFSASEPLTLTFELPQYRDTLQLAQRNLELAAV